MTNNYPELYREETYVMLEIMEEQRDTLLEELRTRLKTALKATVATTRARLGKSQSDLIDELKKYGLDRSQGSVSQIENGIRLPSVEILYVIAQFLDTSTDYLFGLTGSELSAADIEEELNKAKGEGKINKLMRDMSKARQKQVLDFAEYLLSRETDSQRQAPRISHLPKNEIQRNIATIRAQLDSVQQKYGTDGRRDMEQAIWDELGGIDSGE